MDVTGLYTQETVIASYFQTRQEVQKLEATWKNQTTHTTD